MMLASYVDAPTQPATQYQLQTIDTITKAYQIEPLHRKSHQQYLIEYMHEQQAALNQSCGVAPSSAACTTRLHYLLQFLSKPRLRRQLPDSQQMAHNVLSILYNGNQAQQLFVTRLHDINSRAQFFAVNDYVYQASSMPVRWFGIASQVSKECLTGLGARHCASYVSFGSTKLLGNPPIYAWRQEAGDTVLAQSFNNFKILFNGDVKDAVQWDIMQLQHEQSVLQPIHEKYLAKYHAFKMAYKNVMRLRIPKGVEILQLPSRIRYGCYRMNYTVAQGCDPLANSH